MSSSEGATREHAHATEAHGRFTATEARQAKRLVLVLFLTAAFAGLELAGATLARSQVLLADGVHLLLDVVALALSVAAMRIAVRAPSDRFTFGLRRIEPMAALLNGVLVVAVAVAIAHEAIEGFTEVLAPRPTLMLIVAALALVVHGVSAWLIHDAIEGTHPHDHDAHAGHSHGHALNLRAVWLHLVGDVLGSITALFAAIAIRFGASTRLDAAGSLLVALLLLGGAVKLLRDACLVLLDAAPSHLPTRAVRDLVLSEKGVRGVRELRVWTLGAGHDAVAVSVLAEGGDAQLTGRLRERLRHDLEVEFVTVEVTTDSVVDG
jgi:cobalt-zinc-cadmium efflux system protein